MSGTEHATTADMITALVGAGQLLLSVLTAVAGGLWAFHLWLVQRRDEVAKAGAQRDAEARAELLRLDQQRAAAEQRRVEHAADLVLAFGKAESAESRMWAAMALSLYPADTLPLLAMALGRIDESGAAGVETALAALGVLSLPQLAKMNRLAVSLCGILADAETPKAVVAAAVPAGEDPTRSAERQLARTRRVINQILLHAEEAELALIDLADVDLTGALFRSANLQQARLRKVNLTGADFAHAKLRKAVFRGAVLTDALFTRANVEAADFTGATGPAGFIALKGAGAVFKDCHFKGANFDGADLESADLDSADFSEARLNGARLHQARLVGTNLNQATARKAQLKGASVSHARFASADFAGSSWSKTAVDNSVMTAIVLKDADLADGSIVNCNLGGADFSGATIRKVRFDRCHLGGAKFTGATLEDCVFEDCRFAGTIFDNALLHGVAFEGQCELVGRPLSFVGAPMDRVTFSEGSAALIAGT